MTKAWVVAALALAAAGSAVAETLIFSDDFNTLVSAACERFYVAVTRSSARDMRLGPETHTQAQVRGWATVNGTCALCGAGFAHAIVARGFPVTAPGLGMLIY